MRQRKIRFPSQRLGWELGSEGFLGLLLLPALRSPGRSGFMRRHASLDELTTPLTPDRHCFVIRLRKHYSTGEKAFAFAFFILGTHPPGNSSVLPNPWHTSTSTSSSSSQALCVVVPCVCDFGQTMANSDCESGFGCKWNGMDACADATRVPSCRVAALKRQLSQTMSCQTLWLLLGSG